MKRTKAEKEEHLNLISKLYVKGTTQMDMARQLGVSQGQISNDLKLILKKWETERVHDIDLIKNQQLTRINAIEEEMWIAWEKSKTAKKVVLNKSKAGEWADEFDMTTGKTTKTQTDKYWRAGTTEEEPTGGDMQYMNGIMWCIQERAKIVGLYAPKKVAQTDPTGEFESQSAKEILGDIIGGILKRAKDDSNIVEGELLELDGNNSIGVDGDDTPELARRLREAKMKRLPPSPRKNSDVEFDQEGNILVEAS
jgi:hypothetical protein